jgi:hypothetical protein
MDGEVWNFNSDNILFFYALFKNNWTPSFSNDLLPSMKHETQEKSSVLTYEAWTPLKLGVTQCPTLEWHLYDICHTNSDQCPKNLFSSLLRRSLDQCPTLVWHTTRVGQLGQVSQFFFLCSDTPWTHLRHIYKIEDVWKQCWSMWGDIKFVNNILIFLSVDR